VLDALAETSALLRGSVKGRYVAPDSFHVTLAFLGDTPVDRVDAAAEAIEAGCREFSRFGVTLGSLGSFGKRSAATLWQGFDDAGDLPELAAAVRDELRASGFSFDAKSFRAHVTLMRKADLTRGTLPMPAQAAGDVRSVVLFKSDLSGARPVYEPLHVVDLL
jgi:2'-5' RNA ligase